MSVQDYIVSERFIHDDLIRKSQQAVNKLYEIWKAEGHIEASLLTWPSEPIIDDEGKKVEGVCALELPEDREERHTAIRSMVKRTKAYGLLLIETVGAEVRAILETPHGTKCWIMPIQKSGDVKILGEPTITTNRENVGLLWAPQRAVA